MRRRDEPDFTEFTTAAVRRLRRTAYLMCGDWHRAEDAAQDALVRVYKAWSRLDHSGGLNTYAHKAVVSVVLDQAKRPWRREHLIDELPGQPVADQQSAIDNRRGRRGQRLRRAGVVTAGAVTAGAFVTAVAVWTGGDVARNNGGGMQPASGPTSTVTAKAATQITWVEQPPAATNFTTAQIRALCNAQDSSVRDGTGNKAGGGTDAVTNWSVEVSQGQAQWFRAILLSPDRQRYTFCAYNSGKGAPHDTYNREATKWFAEQPYRVTTWPNGAWGQVPADVDKIVFALPDGTRSVATTKNGWFLWVTREHVNYLPNKPIWAIYYGINGKEIARFDSNPDNPAPKPPVCTQNAHCKLDHIEPHQPVFPT